MVNYFLKSELPINSSSYLDMFLFDEVVELIIDLPEFFGYFLIILHRLTFQPDSSDNFIYCI